MKKEIALKNIIDLNNIFKKNKAPCWIQDGTLLGYFREKDFISHDLDTDMGMMIDDFSNKILEDSVEAGFRYIFLGYPESCLQITFSRFDVRTDVFFFYNMGRFVYHSAFSENNRIDYRYERFNLKEVSFLGNIFLAPSDELKFIVAKYGNGWQFPDVEWNYAYSPKNHYTNGTVDFSKQSEKIKKWLSKISKSKSIKKIITYGTFDTLHYGHIEIIRRAKELGDHLTVAISTDEFNREKGKNSIFEYSKRNEWIKSISYVDEIITESDWSQKKTDIEGRDIDILVMGDDWVGEFDDLPCRTIYLKRTEHISSTEIKNVLRRKMD